MRWQASYSTLSCEKCEKDRTLTVDGMFAGRVPNCERNGPDSCPISAGKTPNLTPELREVIEIYGMFTHPVVQENAGIQIDILQLFRSRKTMNGYRYFYRMLFTLHELHEKLTPKKTVPVAQHPDGGMRALSKGLRP